MTALGELEAAFRARSFAVLVGVDRYQHEGPALPPLRCAAHDVAAVADALVEGAGFTKENVLPLVNESATMLAISERFQRIQEAMVSLRRERSPVRTRLLFYFTGHGLVGQHRGADATFLATYETHPDHLGVTALDVHDLDDMVARVAPDQELRFIDCCHAAGLQHDGSKGASPDALSRLTEALTTAEGRGVVYSCRAGELAWERKDGSLSVFASALVEGLREQAPDVRGVVYLSGLVDHLGRRVQKIALEERGKRQTVVADTHQIRGPLPVAFRIAAHAKSQRSVERDALEAQAVRLKAEIDAARENERKQADVRHKSEEVAKHLSDRNRSVLRSKLYVGAVLLGASVCGALLMLGLTPAPARKDLWVWLLMLSPFALVGVVWLWAYGQERKIWRKHEMERERLDQELHSLKAAPRSE